MNYDLIDDSKMSKCQRQILTQAKTIQSMRKQVELLEKSVSYSRQFYHLPQEVLDLFSILVPSRRYDEGINWEFYNEVVKLEELRGEG